MSGVPSVQAFHDNTTGTNQFVVWDPESKLCAIVDSVLDYDLTSAKTSTECADALVAFVREKGLTVEWILETHVHADHMSASDFLKKELGGKTGIGASIIEVQALFAPLFNMEDQISMKGEEWDRLFEEGDEFDLGAIKCSVLHTPGHTPACVSYVIGDAIFCGDTIFMHDAGTARCDFPGGSAHTLWGSVEKLLSLPEDHRMFVGHDYGAGGKRERDWMTTIKMQKKENPHVVPGKDEFLKMRTERDATLGLPRLMIPSLQVNLRAGRLPEPEANGQRYIKFPLNYF